MRDLFKRLTGRVRQEQSLVLQEESALTLVLRQGHRSTTFDRLSRTVVQNARLAARFGVIQHVRIERLPANDGAPAWLVELDLSGSRRLEVGRSSDEAEASRAAARVAAFTGVPVVRGD
jgi:hypothetical protein